MEPVKKDKFSFPGLMERLPTLPHASGIHLHVEKPSEKPPKARKEKPGPAANAPPQPGTGTNKTGKPRKIL